MNRRRKEAIERTRGLRSLALFAECTDAELRQIDNVLTRLEVDAGATLTVEGAAGRQAMIVIDGNAVATRAEWSLGMIGPGSIIGERALLGGGTRNATVTAVTPMTLFVVNAAEFRELLRASPNLKRSVTRIARERETAGANTSGNGSGCRSRDRGT